MSGEPLSERVLADAIREAHFIATEVWLDPARAAETENERMKAVVRAVVVADRVALRDKIASGMTQQQLHGTTVVPLADVLAVLALPGLAPTSEAQDG